MDILQLIQLPESKTLEFKRDASLLEPILKCIVAFANTTGGILSAIKKIPKFICRYTKMAGKFGAMQRRDIPEKPQSSQQKYQSIQVDLTSISER